MKRTVHLVKVGNLIDVANVDDCEILDLVGDFVQYFVLLHAVLVPIASESNDLGYSVRCDPLGGGGVGVGNSRRGALLR